jgi:protein-tyrosine phosphatase
MLNIESVLVVCEGNHCRSPIGEALLRERSSGRLDVSSAGLGALVGMPPAPLAQRLMAERGLDISGCRGRQLTPAMALAADLILVMDERQKTACGLLAPRALARTFLLGHWRPAAEREIIDPFRASEEIFAAVVDQIDVSVNDWLPRLLPSRRHP